MLQDALGRSSKQQEPPRNLHRKAMEQKGEGEQREKLRNRFGSTSSSLREIPSSSSASSFYRSRRSRSALNAYLPYLTLFDPPRYLIRLHVLLGAHVREAPVPTPWCPIPPLDGFLHDTVMLSFVSCAPLM